LDFARAGAAFGRAVVDFERVEGGFGWVRVGGVGWPLRLAAYGGTGVERAPGDLPGRGAVDAGGCFGVWPFGRFGRGHHLTTRGSTIAADTAVAPSATSVSFGASRQGS
jgi:hypothetical protein